jgi:hypothetical protein
VHPGAYKEMSKGVFETVFSTVEQEYKRTTSERKI